MKNSYFQFSKHRKIGIYADKSNTESSKKKIVTFSSQERQSAASSAAQKRIAAALSQTSQRVRILFLFSVVGVAVVVWFFSSSASILLRLIPLSFHSPRDRQTNIVRDRKWRKEDDKTRGNFGRLRWEQWSGWRGWFSSEREETMRQRQFWVEFELIGYFLSLKLLSLSCFSLFLGKKEIVRERKETKAVNRVLFPFAGVNSGFPYSLLLIDTCL